MDIITILFFIALVALCLVGIVITRTVSHRTPGSGMESFHNLSANSFPQGHLGHHHGHHHGVHMGGGSF